MIVSPDEIKANKAPRTSPLKHCDMKLAQLITRPSAPSPDAVASGLASAFRLARLCHCALPCPGPLSIPLRLGILAKIAAKGIGLLHQRLAGQDFQHFPEVFRVFHVTRLLAADDDDRTDQLVIGRPEMYIAHGRREGF